MNRTIHTRRLLLKVTATLTLLVVLAAACSDDSGGDADPASSEPTDTASSTTTLPGTTAPIPEEGEALVDLQIRVVEFGADGFVEIANRGDDDVDLNGIYSCQFPIYEDLGTVLDDPVVPAGGSVQVPAAIFGALDAATGEAALYQGNSFESADTILAYVAWGEGDHKRASVAAEAGLWPSADAAATPDPAFNSIELGGDPADPANWS